MVNLYEEIDGNYTGADFGYTNQSFPVLGANDEILTVTYYDNYHFDQYNILVICEPIIQTISPLSSRMFTTRAKEYKL